MPVLMKVLHLLAVVVLLGNLLMAPFWRKRLARSGGPQARAAANRAVQLADRLFTLPGWVGVLVTGIVLAVQSGAFRHGWLHLSLLVFVAWLVVWHAGALRARKAMIAAAETAGEPPAELAALERRWAQWSYLAAALVVLVLVLMVWQPI